MSRSNPRSSHHQPRATGLFRRLTTPALAFLATSLGVLSIPACGSADTIATLSGGSAGSGGHGGEASGSTGGASSSTGAGSIPRDEVCGNGRDDNRDGRIDEGCESESACACPADSITWDRVQAPDGLTLGGWEAAQSAWSGTVHAFAYAGSTSDITNPSAHYDVYFARYGEDGAALGTTLVYTLPQAPLTGQVVGGVIWNGTDFVILVRTKGTSVLLRVGADGKVEGDPVDVGGPNGHIAWSGTELGVLHDAPPASNFATKVILDRFDANLQPIGSPAAVSPEPTSSTFFTSRRILWTGARWMVLAQQSLAFGADPVPLDPTTVVFVDGSTVSKTVPVNGKILISPIAAASGHDEMVCWWTPRPGYNNSTPVSCQRFSTVGEKLGSVVDIGKGPFEMGSGGIVAWQCGYLVMLPGTADHAPEEPALDSARVVRVRDDGAVEDVPLPPGGPDIAPPGSAYGWILNVYWGDVEFSTGDLYFPTRWFAPYQKSGRMRVSCGK